MFKKLFFLITLFLCVHGAKAQTEEELKATMAAKKDSIAVIQGRVNAIQAKIDALPGWRYGAFGTIGGSLSGFENWFSQGIPNNDAGNIGITINGFANLKESQYFWRNTSLINLGWVKLDNKDDPTDSNAFREATDVFTITSLFGYNLTKSIAASVLGEYRTTLLDNFNNPGYLDLGVGFTWNPVPDLVVVVHPLNYNFVFSDGNTQFESSLGAKIVADYTRKIGAIHFKTNFSAFLSYEDTDYSNWTWMNSFSYTFWKNIGLGLDLGLRSNKQEAFNAALAQIPAIVPTPTLQNTENKLQSFWNFGFSYNF